jgi:PPK2 family polyphosphate:nucleotide phosphotransferase
MGDRYWTKFRVKPGSRIHLNDFPPDDTHQQEKQAAIRHTRKLQKRMDELQFHLYAEHKRSLLICLQAPDAGGKDGVIRHVIGSMNPQGCRIAHFGEPSAEELDHDFLWRVEQQTPGRGEIAIFNRSHYEDVLVVRVRALVPKHIWSKRYREINAFEKRLFDNGTHIVKFLLHISKEEQLRRLERRLDDPARHWKISEEDYVNREYWSRYQDAYEDALSKCSTEYAPWFIIPSDHKWFRNLLVTEIIVDTLEELGIKTPKPKVDLAEIRRKYHDQQNEK